VCINSREFYGGSSIYALKYAVPSKLPFIRYNVGIPFIVVSSISVIVAESVLDNKC